MSTTFNNNDGNQPPEGPLALVKGDDVGLPVALATGASNSGLLVTASETVRPEVRFESEHRKFHDKPWGLLYVLSFLSFLTLGFFLVANAHPRYEWIQVTLENATAFGNSDTIRIVSSHFRDDVAKCCANKNSGDDTFIPFDLCSELDVDAVLSSRNWLYGQRKLQFIDDGEIAALSNSKYELGDGIFDAFLEAPEILITLSLLALFLALTWIILLRFFSAPIVYATEVVKVAFFLYLSVKGFMEGVPAGAGVSFACAVVIVVWDYYTFDKLQFAGKMLSQAAGAFKENAAMFFAFVPILLLYAGNAGLFVLFFARSFEVVEVETVNDSCEYVSPSYTSPIVAFLSLAYLWSILLFSTMRLSIIATVIGSWHFHPEHQPGLGRAITNTFTSLGTLSVASLLSTIAERINRLFLKENLCLNSCNPALWVIMPLYCVFGSCIRVLVQMLTKYSVVLHVFTGKTWMGSAKKVFKILKRHFKGGFVTELASASVLHLGSFVFSISLYFIAWVWLDAEFKTDSFVGVSDEVLMAVGWCFFALFSIWYPVLGLYLIILVNRWLSQSNWEPETWVSPMAAAFIGCIAMMFFNYLAGTFLDTVDVLFLCFAIDRDNKKSADNEFAKLVFEGVPAVLVEPDLEGTEKGDDEESGAPVALAEVTP